MTQPNNPGAGRDNAGDSIDTGGATDTVDTIDHSALDEMVAATDSGPRHPGGAVGALLAWTALAWSAFQLWIASPLPYMFSDFVPVLNNTDTKSLNIYGSGDAIHN